VHARFADLNSCCCSFTVSVYGFGSVKGASDFREDVVEISSVELEHAGLPTLAGEVGCEKFFGNSIVQNVLVEIEGYKLLSLSILAE
jgi:hypothetical protein